MGQRLRPIADRLEGYDISASMLKQARAKGVYDLLAKADLRDFSYAGPKADLVTAADVFIYVGALEGVVKTIAGMLAGDGLFAFSVEKLAGGVRSAISRCSRHAATRIRKPMCEGFWPPTGFRSCRWKRKRIRQDRREPVEGLVVVARLPSRLEGIVNTASRSFPARLHQSRVNRLRKSLNHVRD